MKIFLRHSNAEINHKPTIVQKMADKHWAEFYAVVFMISFRLIVTSFSSIAYSKKQPDLCYFEAIEKMSRALLNFVWTTTA